MRIKLPCVLITSSLQLNIAYLIFISILVHPLPQHQSLGIAGTLITEHSCLFGLEAHLVHAFTCIPMHKSLPLEHGCELLAHASKHILGGIQVSNKSSGMTLHTNVQYLLLQGNNISSCLHFIALSCMNDSTTHFNLNQRNLEQPNSYQNDSTLPIYVQYYN